METWKRYICIVEENSYNGNTGQSKKYMREFGEWKEI